MSVAIYRYLLAASALSARFILSGNDGIANEKDVLLSVLQTTKSPIPIISMPNIYLRDKFVDRFVI